MNGGAEARILGKWGEHIVAEDLRAKGWEIVEMNYHCRFGEIDLIVKNPSFLVFVEVKLRRNERYGQAKEAVTALKQGKLRAAAELYLQENRFKLQPRFDVAEVYAPQGIRTMHPRISYVENAF